MARLVPEMLRAPGAGPVSHLGGDHPGAQAHAEIIVGAPDGHVLDASVPPTPARLGKGLDVALDVGEDPILALFLETRDGGLEIAPVSHSASFFWGGPLTLCLLFAPCF